jgi:type II secretory pathway component PulK
VWTLFFLAALAVAVHSHVSASLTLAERFKLGVSSRCAAMAGAECAIFEVIRDTNEWDGVSESWYDDESLFRDVSLGKAFYSIRCCSTSSQGQVSTRYGLVDEEQKISINKADAGLLKSFFEVAGGQDSMSAAEVSASILDWRDENDEALTGGAENSYYSALNEPYSCPNDEFQVLREMLLVKGVDADLFARVEQFLTIHGVGKVNINTAGDTVLRSVARAGGVGDSQAQRSLVEKVLAFRKAGNVFTTPSASAISEQLNDFSAVLPEERTVLSSMMTMLAIRSTCFGGVVEGWVGSAGTDQPVDRMRHRIAFVFNRSRNVKIHWYEY